MGNARLAFLPFFTLGLLATVSAQGSSGAELTYFGRATIKIRTATGTVIYIDPYEPGDYSEAADLILVTHGHRDHNRVDLVTRKPTTVVAAPEGAVPGTGVRIVAEGDTFQIGPVSVRATPAANKNHDRSVSRGFIVSFDGIVVYHAGDTDYLPEMALWEKYGISYALLPCDGFYNMGPAEAARCAEAMKAKRVIPIHSSKNGNFDEANTRAVPFRNLVVLKPGEKTGLEP
ncbi:MAG: MBL fold metallo-hydrolase [Spirochaetae bacterium HGW-Spirochaetae-7]|jgi:L-ascorbate metabolism protein UlaG (beta-lactamase superfamily)|nr:MAG: MBL fold metallo-hydrolase [Spirochaetae bacterium HGW-Spirochaetae-7]